MTALSDIQAIVANKKLTQKQRVQAIAHRRALEVHSHITKAKVLPISVETAKGQLVVTSASLNGHMLTLTGHGVIDDPDTTDDSWTWQIVNPPMLVPDPKGKIVRPGGKDHLGYASPDQHFRFDPLAALKQVMKDMA